MDVLSVQPKSTLPICPAVMQTQSHGLLATVALPHIASILGHTSLALIVDNTLCTWHDIQRIVLGPIPGLFFLRNRPAVKHTICSWRMCNLMIPWIERRSAEHR